MVHTGLTLALPAALNTVHIPTVVWLWASGLQLKGPPQQVLQRPLTGGPPSLQPVPFSQKHLWQVIILSHVYLFAVCFPTGLSVLEGGDLVYYVHLTPITMPVTHKAPEKYLLKEWSLFELKIKSHWQSLTEFIFFLGSRSNWRVGRM